MAGIPVSAAAAGSGPNPISCSQLALPGNPTPNEPCAGIASAGGGAHTWGPDASNGFGDRVWLDTWAFIQPQFNFALDINLLEADLAITKSHSPTTFIVGAPFSYEITARNDGPSDVIGARISDALPAELGSLSVTGCVPAGGAVCTSQSIVASDLNAVADLPNGGSVTYTITGIVDSLPASGQLTNQATILRTTDVNDPDATNPDACLLYTSPSPRDLSTSRMPSSA